MPPCGWKPYFGAAIAIGITTGVFGISFGVLSVAAGLSVAETCAMSLLVFTGASQFAAIGVVASAGAPVAAVAAGLLLGVRNAAYGLTVSPFLPRRLVPRVLSTQVIIDESTALALANPDDKTGAFIAGGVSVFVFWNLGTLFGALAGSGIGDPSRFGLDAAFPASLLALVAPRLRDRSAVRAFLQPGLPIIVAGLAILPGLIGERA
jgi:predicted branched-subunit amino acid permease